MKPYYFLAVIFLFGCGGGGGGTTAATETETEAVIVVAAPSISSFVASSSTINIGDSVNLTAIFTNGTASINNSLTVTGDATAGGTLKITWGDIANEEVTIGGVDFTFVSGSTSNLNNSSSKNNDFFEKKIDNKSLKFLEKYNNNYITKKVYNNYNNLINSKNDWPITSKLHCMWCVHQFNTIPCGIPVKYSNKQFELEGHFCSFNCAFSYIHDRNDYNKWDKFSLLKLLYTKIFNKECNIKSAPKRELLKIFGGILDIEDFRDNFCEIDKSYKFYMPPLVPIISKIECTKVNNNEFKPINNNLMNKANKTNVNNFNFQNNNMNLVKINI